MKLTALPSSITDWSTIAPSEHPGESGAATMRVRQFGDIQLRLVEYSPVYLGDHWCNKGHLTLVVSGELLIEHEDGTRFTLRAGTSWHVADNEPSPHRARSISGAIVFVVD